MPTETLTITQGLIETGETTLKVTIEGESNMPFWNHDLKVKAILALLESIDIKHYYEENKQDEGFKSYEEIVKTAKFAFGLDMFDID